MATTTTQEASPEIVEYFDKVEKKARNRKILWTGGGLALIAAVVIPSFLSRDDKHSSPKVESPTTTQPKAEN